jgi:hypothetical protein
MKSGYIEQLKSDIAARFEKDLRKPRAKRAVKPTMEEDTALKQQLKSDIAARFERDLRKPRAKPAVKRTMEEDTALEQQKQDHFVRLLMAEAVRQLK